VPEELVDDQTPFRPIWIWYKTSLNQKVELQPEILKDWRYW
jgi:hypothetical protein